MQGLTQKTSTFRARTICSRHRVKYIAAAPTDPFFLHTTVLAMPKDDIIGAESVYLLCKGWLNDIQGTAQIETEFTTPNA